MKDKFNAMNAFDTICYVVKSLALFFCFYPLFSLFFEYAPRETMNTMSISSMLVSVLLLVLMLAIWLILQPARNRKPWQRLAEIVVFLSVCVASVLTSGGPDSRYKFLFIFIVVTYTFQYSTRIGLMIATVSSLFLLGLDISAKITTTEYVALDSDIALSIMFFIVAVIIGRYVALDRQHIEELTRQVNIDGLTELYNHRYFHELMDRCFREAKDTNADLALLMLDLDYFKVYNDVHGHQEGDRALRVVADTLRACASDGEYVCRYGGEEFVVIMPGTNGKTAVERAEKMRVEIMNMDVIGMEFLPARHLTASFGISTILPDDNAYDSMLQRADQALYRAKYLRKNSVQTYYDMFDKLEPDDRARGMLMSVRGLVGIINQRDNYTFNHTERVAMCCDSVAELMGLETEDHRKLVLSAYMHDIGKIEVPKEILIANRRLTDEEFEQVKMHPEYGRVLINRIEGMEEIATIVSQHHERYDGTGYPHGLDKTAMHPLSFILSLADSFDAMTNNRPYQKKRTVQQALNIIRSCEGTQFHPEYAERFIAAVEVLEARKLEK